uniref:Uncharacterized protein n=1 Tax=Peromyscus maniculatus bairdii TaxID=230844 RepID=A0A8C8TJ13_PERMB
MLEKLWQLLILKENKFFNSRCLNYCEWAQSLMTLKMLWGIHTLKTGSNVQKKWNLMLCQSQPAAVGGSSAMIER